MSARRFRSPRLVTRLALAFGLIAALPLMVVPLVIQAVSDSYDRTFARDLEEATKLVRSELDRMKADVVERTRAATRSSLLPEINRRLDGLEGSALVDLAGPALSESGLDILEVVERDGRILLSGHLPARMGDIDPLAQKLLAESPKTPVLAEVEMKEGDEIQQTPALVFALPVDHRVIIGGRLFGAAELTRLSELVRGRVQLLDAKPAPEVTPKPKGIWRVLRAYIAGPTRRTADVTISTLDGDKLLRLSLSNAALMATKIGIARGALVTFVVTLLFGLLLAFWLARRTVGPVEALVDGTKRLAEGDLSYRVDVKATAELAHLIDAFNAMAAQLSTARERLAHAERIAAWEQIARALAHEIKNPLTPIAMAIETLQRTHDRKHPEFDRFFKEGTATVLEEVGRLKRLATEFGEFARWPKPVLSPASPAELIRSAISLYGTLPPGHSVEAEVDEALPNVTVDRDHLQRALVNLVKNALEASPNGVRIRLRARREGAGVALEVIDNGPGIPADSREKLFQPYYTTKAEGTGLGLAIVHRIVTEHQGRISVDETPGGGATFRIWLPAVKSAVAA
jgi:nitrogen fixation/metabolism regulation signal transduction histidine kinase